MLRQRDDDEACGFVAGEGVARREARAAAAPEGSLRAGGLLQRLAAAAAKCGTDAKKAQPAAPAPLLGRRCRARELAGARPSDGRNQPDACPEAIGASRCKAGPAIETPLTKGQVAMHQDRTAVWHPPVHGFRAGQGHAGMGTPQDKPSTTRPTLALPKAGVRERTVDVATNRGEHLHEALREQQRLSPRRRGAHSRGHARSCTERGGLS